MFKKQTYNYLYLNQKETIPIQVLWNQKKWMCGLLLEMTKSEQILCLDYKLEKMNKHKDFQWPH